MDSQETQQETKPNEETISICDVWKNNTSKVLEKLESQSPTHFQLYSNLYTEYLHYLEDLFGTCYISEKQFFDKLGVDQKTIKGLDNFWSGVAKNYTSQIDMYTQFLKVYVQMRISVIKSYDRYMHVFMDSYAKMLSQYNSAFSK